MPSPDIVYKYLTTLTNSATIYDFVINYKPTNLQEAVEFVVAHSKSHPKASSNCSQLCCSLCKRLGHTAKTCRSKGANKGNQRSKKVDVIEEEDTIVANADVGSDGEDSGSYGEPEMQDVECLSGGEQEDAMDMFPAEIEDLGKRKGTNSARDAIVKNLRDFSPNRRHICGRSRHGLPPCDHDIWLGVFHWPARRLFMGRVFAAK